MPFGDIELILVPTDFSEASANALTVAIELARAFKAAIALFHVDVDPSIEGQSAENLIPVRYLFESVIAETRRRMDHVLAETRRAGVACTSASEFGRSSRAIVEYARQRGAGAIVLGQHRRHRLRHALVRTVAEYVVRHAPCPVLVVPLLPASGRAAKARSSARKEPNPRPRAQPARARAIEDLATTGTDRAFPAGWPRTLGIWRAAVVDARSARIQVDVGRER